MLELLPADALVVGHEGLEALSLPWRPLPVLARPFWHSWGRKANQTSVRPVRVNNYLVVEVSKHAEVSGDMQTI